MFCWWSFHAWMNKKSKYAEEEQESFLYLHTSTCSFKASCIFCSVMHCELCSASRTNNSNKKWKNWNMYIIFKYKNTILVVKVEKIKTICNNCKYFCNWLLLNLLGNWWDSYLKVEYWLICSHPDILHFFALSIFLAHSNTYTYIHKIHHWSYWMHFI